MRFIFLFLSLSFFIISCDQASRGTGKADTEKPEPRKRTKPRSTSFHWEPAKEWITRLKTNPDSAGKKIILAVNRVDLDHIRQLDSIIVPDDLSGDLEFYLPFPVEAPALKDIDKIVLFSYPAQVFAAYEHGELAYTGPTSMGSKSHPTPEGLYFANWKAEETVSTFDDEWVLRWNFNIENKEGIGWHQYALPGYPASHSCLRMLEGDARFMYTWADQWVLKGTDNILANGTPVVVIGSYPFDGPKPWLQLVNDPKALDISKDDIASAVKPHLEKILAEQQKRQQQKASASAAGEKKPANP